jgi:hypothetical protein
MRAKKQVHESKERLIRHQRHHRPLAHERSKAPSGSRLFHPASLTSVAAYQQLRPVVATMTYCQPCSDASHARRVDAFTDWILQRVDELVSENQDHPLVVPLTVTFSLGSIAPDQVLREYERFYLRLCSLLMNNHERPSKRHLLPFAIAFRDDPSTRPGEAPRAT